jgi:hypothetical protein
MEIYGATKFATDGTYVDEPIDQEFLNLIECLVDDDIYEYTPNGEQSETKEELIDMYYPIWKAENNK